MTSRERFLASLQCRPVDRLFRMEHGPWPTTRLRWNAEGMPADADFNRYFQMDGLVRLSVQSGYTSSPYWPAYEVQTIEETADTRTYVDRDGILKKERKPSDLSMPQFLRFPVQGRDDWAKARARLRPQDAPARIGDPERLARQCADGGAATMMTLCGAFGHPRNLLGDEGLSLLIFDDPALLEEILDNWRDLYVELLREVTRHVRLDSLLIWEDMCYKNGPLISPEHFRRFMLPRYVDVIGEARACGASGVIVDTDGDCRKMIPLFLEAGVDCLMPFEVQAGMDVVALGEQYPSLCFMGGIDKRALAAGPGAIRAEVDRVLPAMVRRGGFIPTLDHTVPPDVSLENMRYYLQCLREYERP